jgi:hypothetical protein
MSVSSSGAIARRAGTETDTAITTLERLLRQIITASLPLATCLAECGADGQDDAAGQPQGHDPPWRRSPGDP